MPTLHLDPRDHTAVTVSTTGHIAIDLTDTGTRTLATAGAKAALLTARSDARARAHLAAMPNKELAELASQPDPHPFVREEGLRRIQTAVEALRPVIAVMVSAGLLTT
jgi:hypothetical protein